VRFSPVDPDVAVGTIVSDWLENSSPKQPTMYWVGH